MNNDNNKSGGKIKSALENETRRLTLAPETRRMVIAAAAGQWAAGWDWIFNRRLVLAAACVILVCIVIPRAGKKEKAHVPEVCTRTYSEITGGKSSAFFKKRSLEVLSSNGEERYIKISATWTRQKSLIAPSI
jgi:hypothetical protein